MPRRVLPSALLLALACVLFHLAPVPATAAAGRSGRPPATTQVIDPGLQQIVQSVLRSASGRYSVVVHSLVDGRRASVNADREIEAASIYKLFVMYEVFRQERQGRFSFETVLTVTARAAAESLGLPTPAAGDELTVRAALERMIQVSDNTCAVLLGDLVGWARMREALREIGIRDTEFWPELTTTAEDVDRLLTLIGAGQAVDRAASAEMLDILLGQRWNDRLPQGLPDGIRIGHKTGELPGILHDAGIVVAPFGRYTIVVLSEGGNRATFIELARQVHAYLATPSADVY